MKAILSKCARLLGAVLVGLILLWLAVFVAIRRPSFGSLRLDERDVARPGASADELHRHVQYLAGTLSSRDAERPGDLEDAARFIESEFRRSGGVVELQDYLVRGRDEALRNVIARFGPSSGPRIVVGAHYDSFVMFGVNPGADDNASGTAGLLELARLLGEQPPPMSVELVAFTAEEPPYFASPSMGSAVHARSLIAAAVPIRFMVCLEMIGYYSKVQPWPNFLLRSLYPDSGDFVAIVGHHDDRHIVDHFKRAFRAREAMDAYGFIAPSWLPGVDSSDHRSYWQLAIPAVMITDTGFIRNPNYHTARDTPETLDYERMAEVVGAVFLALITAGTIENG